MDSKSVFLSLLKAYTAVFRFPLNSLMTFYVASYISGVKFFPLRIFFSAYLYSKLLDNHPLEDHFSNCDEQLLWSFNIIFMWFVSNIYLIIASHFLLVQSSIPVSGILNILCNTLFFFSIFSLCFFVLLSGSFLQHYHIMRFLQIFIQCWMLLIRVLY